MAATNLTLGSGGSGGIFAPSLFMGAMLGVAFGIGLDSFFPGLNVQPGAYALVGMGAVFAGAAHAPITAVIMLFELTGDYRIVLPLMLTVIISTILSRSLLDNESIYTLKLTRRGIRLQSGRDVDILQAVTVEEAMTHKVDTVPTTMTLVELSEAFSRSRHHGFAVVDENERLWGIVTISDLERALARNAARSTPVNEIGTGNGDLQVTYPDETMDTVLSRMGTRGLGRLPVVSRLDRRHLLGLIRREDIISAYRTALTRRAELQHRAKRMRLRNIDETEFLEIPLTDQCAAVGKTLVEIAGQLPDECIVISIRRGNRVLIPHGDTIFQAGDRVTAFVRSRAVPELYTCLLGPDLPGAGD